jgi:hypothetical protein
MNKLFHCGLLIITTTVAAQDVIVVKGKIVDSESNDPLPYATINVIQTAIGTISNQVGEFEFFVPSQFADDTLSISYVGYKTFKSRVMDARSCSVFHLDESPSILKEVIVRSDETKALVENAVKAIPIVYASSPYLMEGFHRSWEKVDFTDSISYPGTLIEAAVTIYDPGYGELKSRKKEEEVYINEVRRSSINRWWDYGSSTLNHLLKRNLVKHKEEPAWNFVKSFLMIPNNLEYEFESDTYMDDEPVSVIGTKIPNSRNFPVAAKIYISNTDRAILRFDVLGEKDTIDYSVGPWHTQQLQITFIFSRYQGIPYLRYACLHYIIKNLDLMNRKVIRTEEYHRELLINKIITENIEEKLKPLSSKKSKTNSLALQSGSYNASFWKTYNMIKENPLDVKIGEYFEASDFNR